MQDPTYSDGIDADSIVNMVFDLGDAFKGKSIYITAPKPINGIGPTGTINLKDDGTVLPLNTGQGIKNATSRRSQAYNLNRGTSPPAITTNYTNWDGSTMVYESPTRQAEEVLK